MITNFNDLFAELKAKGICKRMVAAWGVDSHTIEAASLASDKGFVKVTLVGDADMIAEVCNAAKINIDKFTIVDIKDELKAVAEAVRMVHDGEGDVLMKGLCSTDKFLRAILNKECGLLPAKGLLSHVGVIENPNYHKLIFITDMAVIPAPDFRQKVKMAGFVTGVARSFGIVQPKIAFIAASEPAKSRPSVTARWLWMWLSTRNPWKSRSSRAPLPATQTACCSPTSRAPMCSGKPTPSWPRTSVRPASWWVQRSLASWPPAQTP